MHAFRLAVLIAALLFVSVFIARLVHCWTGTNRAVFTLPLSSSLGRVESLRVLVPGGQPVVLYRGIPYALPPIGELRFRPYLEDPAVTLRKLRILARRLRCEVAEETTKGAAEELSCLRRMPTAALRRRLVGLNGDLLENSISLEDASVDDATHSSLRGVGEAKTLLLLTAADEGFFFVDHVISRFSEPGYLLTRWLKAQGVRDVAAFLEEYEGASADGDR
ncbi:uncharacterized protein LOC119448144 isoform X2 [Dermacentor silvarum]|uniref:uncharacterized protein LOC119448144 isoform X2 n=1 Tax=Dermacentor silvarum TaxID=543639 RepID=UPI002101AB41|nr:uncharacterized protein LOC119448144 isoform X2 [Dermacentor silvarum]